MAMATINVEFFILLLGAVFWCMPVTHGEEPKPATLWELKLLGVDNVNKLEKLCRASKPRRVSLGIVGQGGVSKARLKKLLANGNTITYHECGSAAKSTHDTNQLRIILELTSALETGVDVHIWQPGGSVRDLAEKFRKAAEICDIVCFYQSFWRKNTNVITEAIRKSPSALFISPYAEVRGNPTGITPQGSACKPWMPDSIKHFILSVPLSRRDLKRGILTPLNRNSADSEAINFIAPSYYASSIGVTCPSASTTAACAVFLYSVMSAKPSPGDVVKLLRATSGIDRDLLLSIDGMNVEAVDNLQKKITLLRTPPPGKQRKLDAPGILNLYKAYRKAMSESGQHAPKNKVSLFN